MKLDILGGSYQETRYLANNSQRTINWYPVITNQSDKEDSKTQLALYAFVGLTKFLQLPGRYFRGLFNAKTHLNNRLFAVVDNVLYEVFTNGSYSTIGTMSNMSIGQCKVYMTCDSNDEVGIFSPDSGYYFNMLTNTLTQITSASFIGGADTAYYLDTYTVITNNGAVYFNSNSNLSIWNSLNTYSPTFTASKTIAAITFREMIYNFTELTIEPYLNDGTSPWSRLPRSTVIIGLLAKESLVAFNDGMLFLGRNDAGEMGVYFYDGYYTCTPMSPTSITSNWRLIKDSIREAYAHIHYSKSGQIFYRLTIPALNTTYVMDWTSKLWSEQQSTQPFQNIDGSIPQRQFRGRHHVAFKGLNLFGDLYSGKIFIEDEANFTEDNNVIIRTRISQTYCEELKYIPVNSLELDCTTGYGQNMSPNVMLQISEDSGYNFNDQILIPLGSQGDHKFRARVFNLGTARNWTVKLTYSDPADLMIQSAIAHGSVSIN